MLKRTSRSAWTSSRSVQASRIASSWRNKAPSSASGRSSANPVSPKPCERRWVGELLPRELCELPQNHIPGGVSERTVDALEASTSMDASPLPRLFLHPAQPADSTLRKWRRFQRAINGSLQESSCRIRAFFYRLPSMTLSMAHSSAISSCPLTAMEDYGGFRFAFRDPVRGQRGFAGRRSPSSSRARSTPRDGEHGGNGSRKRLHMGYGGSPVHFDFLKLPFKDAGDP